MSTIVHGVLSRAVVNGAVLFVAAVIATACNADGAAAPPAKPGLHFIAGMNASDTVDAFVAPTLIAELRDTAGHAIANAPLLFSIPGGGAVLRSDPSHTIASTVGTSFVIATDAAGRASIWLLFGFTAKTVTVDVFDSTRNLRDSTIVTVTAGKPTSLRLDPQDTALLVGKTLTYRPMFLDRYGNAVPGSATVGASDSLVSIVSSLGVVGAAIGRGQVYAHAGAFTDSARVSVVPAGQVAAYAFMTGVSGQPGGVYVFNTDGSDAHWAYRTVSVGNADPAFPSYWPALSPDGGTLAFTGDSKLRLVATAGGAAIDLIDGVVYAPQFSIDGKWIHFTEVSPAGVTAFWRVRPDGSGLAQVSEQRSSGIEELPSPSPVDDRVAYQSNVETNSPIGFAIRTISSTTGLIGNVAVPGTCPRWSPVGDRIAYLDVTGQLVLMAPDGTALGQIGAGVRTQCGFSWSPTGDWILGRASDMPTLFVIELATGRRVPLPFHGPDGQDLYSAAWARQE